MTLEMIPLLVLNRLMTVSMESYVKNKYKVLIPVCYIIKCDKCWNVLKVEVDEKYILYT